MTVPELAAMPTISGNDLYAHAVALYNAGLARAAAIIFLQLLTATADPNAQAAIAHHIVHCGILLDDERLVRQYEAAPSPTQSLAKLVLDSSLHAKMRSQLQACVSNASTVRLPARDALAVTGYTLLIPAGGTELMTQLWCNLRSLLTIEATSPRRIVVAHAEHEWDSTQKATFVNEFGPLLVFLNLTPQAGTASLRGFQIKLLALATAIELYPTEHIVMSDADILWLRHPAELVLPATTRGTTDFTLGIFRDLWHARHKRHDKSGPTAFLRRLHSVPEADGYELESGVIGTSPPALFPQTAGRVAAALRFMFEQHAYYFCLAYGDKDLFDIALHVAGAPIARRLGAASMLGYVCNGLDQHSGRRTIDAETYAPPLKEDAGVHLHSMLQHVFEGDKAIPNHIHSTLFPAAFKLADEKPTPTFECVEPWRIRFVQQNGINTIGVGSEHMRTADAHVIDTFDTLVHDWLPECRAALDRR